MPRQVFSPLEQFEFGSVLLSVMMIGKTNHLFSIDARESLLPPGTEVLYPDVETHFFYLSGAFTTAAYVVTLLVGSLCLLIFVPQGFGVPVVGACGGSARTVMFFFKNLEAFLVDNLSSKAGVLQIFFPLAGGGCLFLLFGNVGGALPMTQVLTSSLIGVLFTSTSSFYGIISVGISLHSLYYLCLLLPPGCPRPLSPFIVCVETISFCARILSLAVRLFANMTAGHSLLSIFSSFGSAAFFRKFSSLITGVLPTGLLAAIAVLESAVALLQTYVFSLLFCLFLRETCDIH
jgi:ATP synthase subunit 6